MARARPGKRGDDDDGDDDSDKGKAPIVHSTVRRIKKNRNAQNMNKFQSCPKRALGVEVDVDALIIPCILGLWSGVTE